MHGAATKPRKGTPVVAKGDPSLGIAIFSDAGGLGALFQARLLAVKCMMSVAESGKAGVPGQPLLFARANQRLCIS